MANRFVLWHEFRSLSSHTHSNSCKYTHVQPQRSKIVSTSHGLRPPAEKAMMTVLITSHHSNDWDFDVKTSEGNEEASRVWTFSENRKYSFCLKTINTVSPRISLSQAAHTWLLAKRYMIQTHHSWNLLFDKCGVLIFVSGYELWFPDTWQLNYANRINRNKS